MFVCVLVVYWCRYIIVPGAGRHRQSPISDGVTQGNTVRTNFIVIQSVVKIDVITRQTIVAGVTFK